MCWHASSLPSRYLLIFYPFLTYSVLHEYFFKIIMPRYGFSFCQGFRYVSNEQSCLKTTGLYEDILLLSSLFHFFYFIFSAPISFSLCFPISLSLMFFLKSLPNIVEKVLYKYTHTHTHTHVVCIIHIF